MSLVDAQLGYGHIGAFYEMMFGKLVFSGQEIRRPRERYP